MLLLIHISSVIGDNKQYAGVEKDSGYFADNTKWRPCASASPSTRVRLVSDAAEVPVTVWWLFCVFLLECSPDLVHRHIPQGRAGVEAPAACLINCHFTEEEPGSSVFTTAAYVCVRSVTMSTAARVSLDSDREPRTSAQRSRPKRDFVSLCAANSAYNATDSVALPTVIVVLW